MWRPVRSAVLLNVMPLLEYVVPRRSLSPSRSAHTDRGCHCVARPGCRCFARPGCRCGRTAAGTTQTFWRATRRLAFCLPTGLIRRNYGWNPSFFFGSGFFRHAFRQRIFSLRAGPGRSGQVLFSPGFLGMRIFQDAGNMTENGGYYDRYSTVRTMMHIHLCGFSSIF